MRISHNLMALNAQNNLNIVNTKRAKSAEKLSTGYKINRAADDAAGLAISEKMRRLIRGLDQGTENAVDGISWTQIGDGALNEAHDILHRMTELTVKSLNETNTAEDKMYMEMEFEQLQSELDRISTTTKFNEIPIFDQHEVPYYQCEGDVKWDPQQMHIVTTGKNDLTIKYTVAEGEPQKELTIQVPAGEYTTQELMDEIDTILGEEYEPGELPRIMLELTEGGICNVNLEGGEEIDSVSGNLSYLLYQMYKGGGYGALIGTTSFPTEYAELKVVNGQNDYLSFTIEDFDGGSMQKEITIPAGYYTRSELIDYLNGELADTTVKATAYGDGVKLSSDEAIVTGFKGNMFKIDGNGTVYNSVFYDNVKYGQVNKTAATFTGGKVLPLDTRDAEHRNYVIDGTNNTLSIKANGMADSVDLVIDSGEYNATQMANKLNELFAANGLELTASKTGDSSFEGLQIVSSVKGLESQIDIDTSSSAYNTLFVKREYNSYSTKASLYNEPKADSEGVLYATRDLSDLTTTPLTITAGVNDSFKLALNGTEYTITLSAGTYSNPADVVAEINNQLNGSSAPAGYKDMITATLSANKIVLTGNTGKGVNSIRLSEGNGAFKTLFQGVQISSKVLTASGTDSITLNTPFDGTINPSESDITIKVGGVEYDVTLPTGSGVTQDQVKSAIENVIKEQSYEAAKQFAAVSDIGETGDRNFSSTAKGTETVTAWSKTVTGSSEEKEGVVGYVNNKPAVLEIGVPLDSSMKVGDSNNKITLTINGTSEVITLDNGTYTPDALKTALQNKINEKFGTGMGGATVSISNNKLVLTARLPEGANGANTSIGCATSTSSFLKELNTTRTAATWTSSRALASSVAIDGTNNVFSFQYTGNDGSKTVSLSLASGTYTQASLVSEINKQLATTDTGVTASLSSGKLVLQSAEVGKNVAISYNTASGGSSAESLFGPLATPTPAQIVANLDTQASIKIEAGTSDTLSLYVNGTLKTVTLDAGTYNRDQFLTMLNQKFSDAGTGVEAFWSGNKLGYKTTATGTAASLAMNYNEGGSSMVAIYGTTPVEVPGITVSFGADGTVGLSTTKPGYNITVESSSGGPFQKHEVTEKDVPVTYTDGYHSTNKAYIDGVNLSGDVKIDQWNDELKFTFTDQGVSKDVSIDIPDNTYSYADLQTKLQELLDAQLGADKLKATVSSTGVRIEMVRTGSTNRLSGFSGDFYDKVLCKATEAAANLGVSDVDGKQTVNTAYTIGRKDVRSGTVKIRPGISDELSMDLTYGGSVHQISVTLDQGTYSGEQLKEHLQDKINERLVALGLEENLIEVGIGGINTGVYGSNDQNALNFSLSKTATAPSEGQFIIDGVSGNAAFEIFYQTDGKMEPAYIMGSKDVSKGLTIEPDETQLTFKVDGTEYPITIPAGNYTAQEIRDTINDALDGAGAPVVAELDSGKLKISHRKMGEHDIQEVSGSAVKKVFFSENGRKEALDARYVQVSSESGDHITLKRHILNTNYMGINSSCISQTKYAEKALNKIKEAMEYVSTIRSDFGSTQNRLEHTINNNENKSENLQSAESTIRDTDMASEMVAFSNHGILEQAGQAMLAQANQLPQGVLSLLQ